MAGRRTARTLLWIGIALLLVGLAPLGVAMLGSGIAEANGCVLHEGSRQPCLIGGSDWGGALYTMFVMGWLMLLTIWLVPVGLVVSVVGLVQTLRAPRTAPDPPPTA